MYVIPSLLSKIASNNDTTEKYVKYISKESNGTLFSSQKGIIKEYNQEYVIKDIDSNSKGGIRKNEAKWYSPTYCLSEKECSFLVNKCLSFGTITSRNITSISDLMSIERFKYEDTIRNLTILFQNEMAKNFNRENIGIRTEDDIRWYATIEHTRKFKGYDHDVIIGSKKTGQKKDGFQTHIHIVQSRKGKNIKKSLLSPMAKARKRTKQNIGFDRNIFYNSIEKVFDNSTNYARKIEETFEKKKEKKKNRLKILGQIDTENKVKYGFHRSFINKEEINQVLKEANCNYYFSELVRRNLLTVTKRDKQKTHYKDHEGNLYIANKNRWYSPQIKKGGTIIDAMYKFDSSNFTDAIHTVKTLNKHHHGNKQINGEVNPKKMQYANLKDLKHAQYLGAKTFECIEEVYKYLNTINTRADEEKPIYIRSNTQSSLHLFTNVYKYLKYIEKKKENINAIILQNKNNLPKIGITKNTTIVNHTKIDLTGVVKNRHI